MTTPPLSEWLRWVADLPAPFRALPEGLVGGTVRVRAVVADLFATLYGANAHDSLLRACEARGGGKTERHRLGWILAAAHVLWHPTLRSAPGPRQALERLLVEELAGIAAVVPIDALLTDDERREELVRRVLRAMGQTLPDESVRESEDRLKQVDSIERHRVLAAAATRQQRAREVREAMAKKAAEEAAAKVTRE
jgi:hypothetical protein